jgi:CspA family cold shock protein
MERMMPTGRIKYYNPDKGYGFITQDNGEPDVFLHVSAIQGVYTDIQVGQRIKYKVAVGDKGPVAQNAEILLTPIEQKRLSQGKVVIPRDFVPPKRGGDFEVKSAAPAEKIRSAPPTSPIKPERKPPGVAKSAGPVVKGAVKPKKDGPKPKPKTEPAPETKPKTRPKAKSTDQPTFGDLYIQKQIRLQTPMYFGLYNHQLLPVTVDSFTKYEFTLKQGDEKRELPKTDAKYCYKKEDAEGVQALMRYNEEIKSQQLTPIIPRKKRYHIKTQLIQKARREKQPIQVTMREGEIFHGLVDWVSPYEIKMILENDVKVLVFRHAICDFNGPSEENNQQAPQTEPQASRPEPETNVQNSDSQPPPA